MAKKDARIDAYIDKAAAFAQPILKHLRKVVHGACPGVEETLKWNNPSFEYKGMLCGMAAFKAHVVFGFWKAKLLAERGFPEAGDNPLGMGRITSLRDLPAAARLEKMVKAAAALNDEGIVEKRPKKPARQAIEEPAYFLAAIRKNKKAQTAYDAFSPSHKREYLEWITEAKTDATRDRRLVQAIEWIAEGKSRNWKYEPA